MRVSPVAWFHSQEIDILNDANLSAECTHNHPEGIKGAMAVALTIHDCLKLFQGKLPKDSDKETVMKGLKRALDFSEYNINIQKSDVQNRFNETCQGTVPVAFLIVSNSKDFEDAIRQAVSLGADADTLGAIVGSIAEAIWGIPNWIKERALTYLPTDMLTVVNNFHNHVKHQHFK
jgi:ADP-ribosylglycohydrolase